MDGLCKMYLPYYKWKLVYTSWAGGVKPEYMGHTRILMQERKRHKNDNIPKSNKPGQQENERKRSGIKENGIWLENSEMGNVYGAVKYN
jgi:hypothetical protein